MVYPYGTWPRVVHVPLPEQSFGQARRWHAAPVYPEGHEQEPTVRSHTPTLEHSITVCATFSSYACV